MMRWLRLLAVMLVLTAVLAACNGDDETAEATPTQAIIVAEATATTAPLPTDTPLPPPTDTLVPTPTLEPTATATVIPTQGAAGQGQDPGAAATAGAAAGQASQLMAPWQSLIGVAVLNQTICTTLQTLAQTGQQGGLAGLGAAAQLLAAGTVLQGAQQQLATLTGTAGAIGAGTLLTSLQTDQAALAGLVGQWSGGQIDAATAAASLQVICGATNATAAQAQQGAQDAGLPPEEVQGIFDRAKGDADSLLP